MNNLLDIDSYLKLSKVLETEIPEEEIDRLIEDVELSDDVLETAGGMAAGYIVGYAAVLGAVVLAQLLANLISNLQKQIGIKKLIAKEKDPKKAAILKGKLKQESNEEIFIRRKIQKHNADIKKKVSKLDKDKIKVDPIKIERTKIRIGKLKTKVKELEKLRSNVKIIRVADTELTKKSKDLRDKYKKDKKTSTNRAALKSKYRKDKIDAMDKYYKKTNRAGIEYTDYMYG